MLRCLAMGIVAMLVIGSLSGCGAPVGKVQGKVTRNGAPLTEGAVIFQNADVSISVSANLQPDGSYVVETANRKGLPPGDYKVAVMVSRIGSGETPLAVAPGQAPPPKPTIPEKYQSVETSGLTASVKAGDNSPFNFDLPD
ncbi:MAG TPA: hypothetical protein VL096_16305 [Pirellulaceae bacterium]|nr:hypothetical protein [Pirellulaceae bacterium]